MGVSMKFSNNEKVSKKKKVKKKLYIQYEILTLIKIENVNVTNGYTNPFGTEHMAACINGSFA